MRKYSSSTTFSPPALVAGQTTGRGNGTVVPKMLGALPVTVVIPAYNRQHTVARAVRSALGQQPQAPARVLVVDDLSTDDTAQVAARAGADVLTRKVNGGPGIARNTGVAAVTHEWVAFLDSDDEWRPDHLQRLWVLCDDESLCLLSDSAIGVPTGRLFGNVTGTPIALTGPEDVVWPTNVITTSCALVRRRVFQDVGGFREMRLGEDLDLWIRMLERSNGLVLSDVGTDYQEHAAHASVEGTRMRQSVATFLEDYSERPWCTSALTRRLAVGRVFAEGMEQLRERHVALASRHLLALRRPTDLIAVSEIVRWRIAARRRGRAALRMAARYDTTAKHT